MGDDNRAVCCRISGQFSGFDVGRVENVVDMDAVAFVRGGKASSNVVFRKLLLELCAALGAEILALAGEPVASVGHGIDPVSLLAQGLDRFPDCGS